MRQRGLPQWPADDPRRASLVARRCVTADEVAAWAREVRGEALHKEHAGSQGEGAGALQNKPLLAVETRTAHPGYQDIVANAALTFIEITCVLLDRQLASLARVFINEGGFTERLYRVRTARRKERGRGEKK